MKFLMLAIVGAVSAFATELPAGYTAVSPIVAQRGASINTGYKPNRNSRTINGGKKYKRIFLRRRWEGVVSLWQ